MAKWRRTAAKRPTAPAGQTTIRRCNAACARRYRQRVKDGGISVRVEMAPELIELLVLLRVLRPEHQEHRHEIGRAIVTQLANLDRKLHGY
jgi:hypothetical protein